MLAQHVVKDTRRREGQEPTRLDLVFTHDKNSIDEITYTAAIGKSNHDSLTWTYICHADSICSNREWLNFAKGDYPAIQRELEEADWAKLNPLNCKEAWTVFKEKYHSRVKKFVPKANLEVGVNLCGWKLMWRRLWRKNIICT